MSPSSSDPSPNPFTEQSSGEVSSLRRTLEPESMDSQLEVDEYLAMGHDQVNQAFVSDLIGGGPVGPRVIDLGCGTAAIPVLLCQQDSDAHVTGIDSSIEMLEAARIEIELGGVTGRIHLEHADCKTLDGYGAGIADTVISNTVLHHLAEPQQMIAAAIRILRPGGRLFLRDLFRPKNSEAIEQLVDSHARAESDYAKQLLRQSLHAALTAHEIREILASFEVPGDAVQLTSDRHWTIDWTLPV
ncbi:class I SAM-dependent methyltransferase [Stieleria sp. TO1_6]|uniref:class I SAM-dependent methyltransferase n=1 Tax=Stieleria tagensis TaxID=2956795 RepID=UPI00209B42A7|nr:class I SAM-dependent methyltransferase [Stieleria tagensis]MCO8122363.1 class I SAM-dependent methyltransferase [Stieleria tagensis]